MEYLSCENKVLWNHSNELHSIGVFDKVKSINEKPSALTEGIFEQNSDLRKSDTETSDKLSITETPNLYKHNGVSMSNSSIGFFPLPRSLTSDLRYRNARLKYKWVLQTILDNAAFSKTTHSIGSNLVTIEVGQFCASERRLVDLCNQDINFKEDKVDKNIVRRAIHYLEKCQFVRQDVNQGRSIITITIPGFYGSNYLKTEPTFDIGPNLNRTIKEEGKEIKEDKKKTTQEKVSFEPSSFATSLLSEFSDSLFSSIPDYPKESFKKTKTQYQAAERIGNKANHDMEIIRKVIAYAHRPGEFWIAHVHSLTYLDSKFIKLLEQLKNLERKNNKYPTPKSLISSDLKEKERLEKGKLKKVSRTFYNRIAKKADEENRPQDKQGYIINEPDGTRTIT